MFAPQRDIKDKEAFLEHLLGRLPIPQYMIPVLAIALDKLPLTNHSKVDRKTIKNMALPQRVAVDAHEDAELTETMIQLRRVWRQVLGKNSEKLGLAITASTIFSWSVATPSWLSDFSREFARSSTLPSPSSISSVPTHSGKWHVRLKTVPASTSSTGSRRPPHHLFPVSSVVAMKRSKLLLTNERVPRLC